MIEDQEDQVKRLSKEEFAAALRKGQGRALLHVLHYGLDEVSDLVLEACIHNQVYDQQIDSGRGNWLFKMFQGSTHYADFKVAILSALKTETETWNLMQLSHLAREMATYRACRDRRI